MVNTEKIIRISKDLGSLTEDEENIKSEQEDEGPEDSFEMMKQTERAFRLGNDSDNIRYDVSPTEILRDYEEFN